MTSILPINSRDYALVRGQRIVITSEPLTMPGWPQIWKPRDLFCKNGDAWLFHSIRVCQVAGRGLDFRIIETGPNLLDALPDGQQSVHGSAPVTGLSWKLPPLAWPTLRPGLAVSVDVERIGNGPPLAFWEMEFWGTLTMEPA